MAFSPTAWLSARFSLEGKTAMVTGPTRGIGRALVLALAAAGADTVLLQRDPMQTAVQEEIQQLGRKATIFACDLNDKEAVRSIMSRVVGAGICPDILVNSGGINRRHAAETYPESDYEHIIQVNLTATFILCRDFARWCIENGRRGKIINIASLLSFTGGILVPAYAASKGGVKQLTQAFANEWARKGLNVNAIGPGYIETELTQSIQDAGRNSEILSRTPAGRWGLPADLEGPVVFLASAASDFVNGEVLMVDGGYCAR